MPGRSARHLQPQKMKRPPILIGGRFRFAMFNLSIVMGEIIRKSNYVDNPAIHTAWNVCHIINCLLNVLMLLPFFVGSAAGPDVRRCEPPP